MRLLLLALSAAIATATSLSGGAPDDGVLKFTRLNVTGDGGTALQDCTMKEMEKTVLPGGESPQYVRNMDDTFGTPSGHSTPD